MTGPARRGIIHALNEENLRLNLEWIHPAWAALCALGGAIVVLIVLYHRPMH